MARHQTDDKPLFSQAYMRHSAAMSQIIEAEWRIYASVI